MLTAEITAAGKKAVVLSIDDFFHERKSPKLVNGEAVDFDSAAAIDLDLFAECTDAMLNGKDILLPCYDFRTGTRSLSREYKNSPDDIIIFEGIQAVYPEVTSLLAAYPYKSIFINVNDDITVNGVEFTRDEVRLARRLVRDYRFRSASPEFTMEIWNNVRRNEEDNIFPYMKNSDYLLNSLQPYELFLVGQFTVPLLEMIPASSKYFAAASQLLEKFLSIHGSEIDPSCLAQDSLYHEFLG